MLLRMTFLTILFLTCAFASAQDSSVKSTNEEKPNQERLNQERPRRPERSGQESDRSSPADQESREIFFRTLGETRSRGAQELSYLLFQESVRKEINLSDDSAKAAREVLAQTRAAAEKLYEQLKAKEINADLLKTKLIEIMAKGDQDIWKILGGSNANSDRLIGLYVQHRQCVAVLNKIVAEKVGLDEARRHEIIVKKEAEERQMFEDRSRDGQTPGDRFRAWEKMQKKIDGVVSGMLTSEQRTKLEDLKGAPFAFEEFQFPPGPPGRGRDGGRDRNRRDNGHDEKCKDGEKLANDR